MKGPERDTEGICPWRGPAEGREGQIQPQGHGDRSRLERFGLQNVAPVRMDIAAGTAAQGTAGGPAARHGPRALDPPWGWSGVRIGAERVQGCRRRWASFLGVGAGMGLGQSRAGGQEREEMEAGMEPGGGWDGAAAGTRIEPG